MRIVVVLCLLGVTSVLAELPVCIRGGTKCTTADQIGQCTEDRGYCCLYDKPVANSKRCFCKPGFAGKDCQITLSDPDWMQHGQDDLNSKLDTFKKMNNGVAKNVILFLGDGMGFSTVTASRIFKGQEAKKAGEETKFAFEEFPFTGISRTFLANHQIADSAGAASSILTGQKVSYATVGVNSNVIRFDCEAAEGNEVDTVLKWSQDAGKRTGVVSNTRITHATPAASYAHSAERFWECDADFQDKWGNDWWELSAKEHNCRDIAHQFVTQAPGKNINVMLGGGRAKFFPNNMTDMEYSDKIGSRNDGRNLVQEWEDMRSQNDESAKFVWKKSDFDAVNTDETDYLFGLFERSHMRYGYDRTNDGAGEPTLAEMVRKAIKILSKGDEGFFLLVEGGRIDHGHHAGWAQVAMQETIEFDDAVKVAQEVTDDDDTLIAVTADHSHVFTLGGYTGRGNDILGLKDTYDIEPSLDGKPRTTLAYGDGPGGPENGQVRTDPTNDDFGNIKYQHQAMVKTNEESHGGEDVPIYATGPMAHLFTGVHEQSYIAHALAYASCVGANKEHCDDDNKDNQPMPCAGVNVAATNVLVLVVAAMCALWNRI